MKKSARYLSFIAATIILFGQCKKDTSSSAANDPDYSPLTAGSTWNYKLTEGGTNSTYTLTATSRDTMVNGKTYRILTGSDGTKSYLAKAGNDYYRFASFPAIGVNSFEELYLKDNKALNEKWTGEAKFKYQGVDVTASLAYTIKGKGESRTVNGNAFNKVVHVRLDISVFGSALGGGDFYYQQGVGLIENTILISPPIPGSQPFSSSETIVSYQIK